MVLELKYWWHFQFQETVMTLYSSYFTHWLWHFSLIIFANKTCPPWTERDPVFHLHHFIWCYFFICVNLGGIWMRFISARLLSRVFIFLLSFLFRSYYRLCPSAVCRRSWAPMTRRTLHRESLVQIYLSSWTDARFQHPTCHRRSPVTARHIYIYISHL